VVLSFAIAIGTLLYLRKQIADARDAVLADHARSKRQMAMEMCAKWSMFTDPETSSVTRLIESLDLAQCDAIAKLTKLTLSLDSKHHLVNILQLRFDDIEAKLETMRDGDKYVIEGHYLIYIRHIGVRYLNMLESVLVAWSMNIADQPLIEKEFSYLFDESQSRTAMKNFRTRLGLGAFPAIERFIEVLAQAKSGGAAVVRPPIVPG
jgi:hypothetical protein